jgi:hypothetical protein
MPIPSPTSPPETKRETEIRALRPPSDFEIQQAVEPFLLVLWTKIDTALIYPPDLSDSGYSGHVTLEFEVNSRGQFALSTWKAQGAQPVLRAYSLIQIMTILADPLPKTKWLSQSENLRVNVDIEYHTYMFDTAKKRTEEKLLGTRLQIIKSNYAEPQLVHAINRALRKYVPPILPIRGGVYVDFIGLYKFIMDKWQPDEDDLRKERLEMLKEKLDHEVTHSKVSRG